MISNQYMQYCCIYVGTAVYLSIYRYCCLSVVLSECGAGEGARRGGECAVGSTCPVDA